MLTRRSFAELGFMAACGSTVLRAAPPAPPAFLSRRPPESKRRFKSEAVEKAILDVKSRIIDPEIGWLFENCYPNTLDTTVFPGSLDGKPDTFVITGDIHAMWLRDSSAQVWPYLPLAANDPELKVLIEGVIRRQTRCLLIDPYANAFQQNASDGPLKWATHDETEMRPGVGERKWEIDSVCYPIRLAHGYWRATRDTRPFDRTWRDAMHEVVKTLRAQQRRSSRGPYKFQRADPNPTESLSERGYGAPADPVGLIHSGFRPSDDACIFPFLIPSNLFVVVAMRRLNELCAESSPQLATEALALAAEVETALQKFGKAAHPRHGQVWAYEVDGFGNVYLADDANIPSLLALPYLGSAAITDPLYQRTRAFILSRDNPWFFKGSAAEGIGGPHEGADMIWPMSIIMRALTSTSDTEISQCMKWLKGTHAGTGFIHESFQKDDATQFTRPWFAWANTLFGELVMELATHRPHLLTM